MKRPVAAKHPAVAAVKDPHARPSHPRRDIKGDVSSAALAAGLAAGFLAAAAAALVVFPANAGFIGGGGAGFGLGFAAAFGAASGPGAAAGGFCSSAIKRLARVLVTDGSTRRLVLPPPVPSPQVPARPPLGHEGSSRTGSGHRSGLAESPTSASAR